MNIRRLLSISFSFLLIGQNVYSSEKQPTQQLPRTNSFDGLRDLPSIAEILYFGRNKSAVARETFEGAVKKNNHPYYNRPFGIGHDQQATERWIASGFLATIKTLEDAQNFLNLIKKRTDLKFSEDQIQPIQNIVNAHEAQKISLNEYKKQKDKASTFATTLQDEAISEKKRIKTQRKLTAAVKQLQKLKLSHNQSFPESQIEK